MILGHMKRRQANQLSSECRKGTMSPVRLPSLFDDIDLRKEDLDYVRRHDRQKSNKRTEERQVIPLRRIGSKTECNALVPARDLDAELCNEFIETPQGTRIERLRLNFPASYLSSLCEGAPSYPGDDVFLTKSESFQKVGSNIDNVWRNLRRELASLVPSKDDSSLNVVRRDSNRKGAFITQPSLNLYNDLNDSPRLSLTFDVPHDDASTAKRGNLRSAECNDKVLENAWQEVAKADAEFDEYCRTLTNNLKNEEKTQSPKLQFLHKPQQSRSSGSSNNLDEKFEILFKNLREGKCKSDTSLTQHLQEKASGKPQGKWSRKDVPKQKTQRNISRYSNQDAKSDQSGQTSTTTSVPNIPVHVFLKQAAAGNELQNHDQKVLSTHTFQQSSNEENTSENPTLNSLFQDLVAAGIVPPNSPPYANFVLDSQLKQMYARLEEVVNRNKEHSPNSTISNSHVLPNRTLSSTSTPKIEAKEESVTRPNDKLSKTSYVRPVTFIPVRSLSATSITNEGNNLPFQSFKIPTPGEELSNMRNLNTAHERLNNPYGQGLNVPVSSQSRPQNFTLEAKNSGTDHVNSSLEGCADKLLRGGPAYESKDINSAVHNILQGVSKKCSSPVFNSVLKPISSSCVEQMSSPSVHYSRAFIKGYNSVLRPYITLAKSTDSGSSFRSESMVNMTTNSKDNYPLRFDKPGAANTREGENEHELGPRSQSATCVNDYHKSCPYETPLQVNSTSHSAIENIYKGSVQNPFMTSYSIDRSANLESTPEKQNFSTIRNYGKMCSSYNASQTDSGKHGNKRGINLSRTASNEVALKPITNKNDFKAPYYLNRWNPNPCLFQPSTVSKESSKYSRNPRALNTILRRRQCLTETNENHQQGDDKSNYQWRPMLYSHSTSHLLNPQPNSSPLRSKVHSINMCSRSPSTHRRYSPRKRYSPVSDRVSYPNVIGHSLPSPPHYLLTKEGSKAKQRSRSIECGDRSSEFLPECQTLSTSSYKNYDFLNPTTTSDGTNTKPPELEVYTSLLNESGERFQDDAKHNSSSAYKAKTLARARRENIEDFFDIVPTTKPSIRKRSSSRNARLKTVETDNTYYLDTPNSKPQKREGSNLCTIPSERSDLPSKTDYSQGLQESARVQKPVKRHSYSLNSRHSDSNLISRSTLRIDVPLSANKIPNLTPTLKTFADEEAGDERSDKREEKYYLNEVLKSNMSKNCLPINEATSKEVHSNEKTLTTPRGTFATSITYPENCLINRENDSTTSSNECVYGVPFKRTRKQYSDSNMLQTGLSSSVNTSSADTLENSIQPLQSYSNNVTSFLERQCQRGEDESQQSFVQQTDEGCDTYNNYRMAEPSKYSLDSDCCVNAQARAKKEPNETRPPDIFDASYHHKKATSNDTRNTCFRNNEDSTVDSSEDTSILEYKSREYNSDDLNRENKALKSILVQKSAYDYPNSYEEDNRADVSNRMNTIEEFLLQPSFRSDVEMQDVEDQKQYVPMENVSRNSDENKGTASSPECENKPERYHIYYQNDTEETFEENPNVNGSYELSMRQGNPGVRRTLSESSKPANKTKRCRNSSISPHTKRYYVAQEPAESDGLLPKYAVHSLTNEPDRDDSHFSGSSQPENEEQEMYVPNSVSNWEQIPEEEPRHTYQAAYSNADANNEVNRSGSYVENESADFMETPITDQWNSYQNSFARTGDEVDGYDLNNTGSYEETPPNNYYPYNSYTPQSLLEPEDSMMNYDNALHENGRPMVNPYQYSLSIPTYTAIGVPAAPHLQIPFHLPLRLPGGRELSPEVNAQVSASLKPPPVPLNPVCTPTVGSLLSSSYPVPQQQTQCVYPVTAVVPHQQQTPFASRTETDYTNLPASSKLGYYNSIYNTPLAPFFNAVFRAGTSLNAAKSLGAYGYTKTVMEQTGKKVANRDASINLQISVPKSTTESPRKEEDNSTGRSNDAKFPPRQEPLIKIDGENILVSDKENTNFGFADQENFDLRKAFEGFQKYKNPEFVSSSSSSAKAGSIDEYNYLTNTDDFDNLYFKNSFYDLNKHPSSVNVTDNLNSFSNQCYSQSEAGSGGSQKSQIPVFKDNYSITCLDQLEENNLADNLNETYNGNTFGNQEANGDLASGSSCFIDKSFSNTDTVWESITKYSSNDKSKNTIKPFRMCDSGTSSSGYFTNSFSEGNVSVCVTEGTNSKQPKSTSPYTQTHLSNNYKMEDFDEVSTAIPGKEEVCPEKDPPCKETEYLSTGGGEGLERKQSSTVRDSFDIGETIKASEGSGDAVGSAAELDFERYIDLATGESNSDLGNDERMHLMETLTNSVVDTELPQQSEFTLGTSSKPSIAEDNFGADPEQAQVFEEQSQNNYHQQMSAFDANKRQNENANESFDGMQSPPPE